MRRKKFSGYLLNAGLLLATLIVLAISGEAVVRVSGWCARNLRPEIHQASEIEGLMFELRPSLRTRGFGCETVTTNTQGFRSPEINPSKFLIAVLGDSFAFGFGVKDDETNPAVLQKELPEYSVVNAGVNGYTIDQEALLYEAKIAKLQPDIVLLEFVINDAKPKASYDSIKAVEKLPRWWTRRGLKQLIKNQSAIAEFLIQKTKSLYEIHPTPPIAEEWTDEQFDFYTVWFSRLSKNIGATPKVLVIWPDFYTHPKTIVRLYDLAGKNGWDIFDLSQLLGVRYGRLRWDSHPNAETQRIAGEAIAEYLETYVIVD